MILSNIYSCNFSQQKPEPIEIEPESPVVIPEAKEEKWEDVTSIIKPEPNYKLISAVEKINFHLEPKFGLIEPCRDKLAFVKFQEKK